MHSLTAFLLILFLFLLPLANFSSNKEVQISKVDIEFYTKTLNMDQLPILTRAVLMYLRNTYELQNKYVKVFDNDPKLKLRVKIMKYKKDQFAVLRISRGESAQKNITVYEDRIRYFENLTDHEKKLRKDIKDMFKRENFTEREVKNYMLFVLFICEAIDKTIYDL